MVVPRSRFAPVKACSDLFMLRSDVYKIHNDATIVATVPVTPLVKLDDAHYKLVDQMEVLVLQPPSLRDATSLTIKGAAKFDACEFQGLTFHSQGFSTDVWGSLVGGWGNVASSRFA